MNKKNQIGIFGLDYENNLENFYINALKKLKYNNIKFLKNNHLFYIFCLHRSIALHYFLLFASIPPFVALQKEGRCREISSFRL